MFTDTLREPRLSAREQVALLIGGHADEIVFTSGGTESNNETGVLQPIEEIVGIAQASGALVHTDAAQSVGKVRVAVNKLGVDLPSLVGHKMYAPKGVGALYVRRGTRLAPFMRGASHERGMRAGTENVASIVGLGMACQIATLLASKPNRKQTAQLEAPPLCSIYKTRSSYEPITPSIRQLRSGRPRHTAT